KFLIAEAFSGPTLHHFVDSETLFPAKLLVEEVRIVNNLRHHQHLLVANVKRLDQRLKSTVLTPQPTTVWVLRPKQTPGSSTYLVDVRTNLGGTLNHQLLA